MSRRLSSELFRACGVGFLLLLALSSNSLSLGKENAGAGSAVDPKTGLKLPARLGAFDRYGPIEYDPNGDPMGTYRAGALILLNLYYYKNDFSFSQEFANCRDEVKIVQPAARLLSDEPSRLQGAGRRAVFTFQGKFSGGPNQKLSSELLIFPHRGRFLKFRVTYPAVHAERARTEIDAFVRSLKLP